MLNFYLYSVGIALLSLLIYLFRFCINKESIKRTKSKEGAYIFIRILIIIIIPVVNILATLTWLYYSISSYEKYIERMND